MSCISEVTFPFPLPLLSWSMGHTDDSQLALVHGPWFELGNLGKKARYYDYEIT